MSAGSITAESLRAAGHLKWTASGPGLLGACAAEMDYGTAPPVTAALAEAVGKNLLGYLPPALATSLREACAAWQRDAYGWDITPDDVRVLPDVIRAFHVAIEHFSRPGSAVIVPVPTFTPFLTIPGLLGRRVIQVELVKSGGRYVYDLDALARAFAEGGHLLVLCNPHNPVGRVLEGDELGAISEVVDRYSGRVFSDEVHAPLVYRGHRHVPYAATSSTAAHHTVTAVSASKAWNLAGLKCAQMVLSNDDDRARWENLGRLATDGTSTLGVVAGTAAYRGGGTWLDGVRDRLDRNRRLLGDLVHAYLPGVRYLPPEGTYLAWLDCRELALPSPDLAEFFIAEAGVTTVDGGSCGLPGRGFARLNFATTEPILTRIVRQMGAAVAVRNRAAPTPEPRDFALHTMWGEP
ncbi:MalY/PatB family protein [Streptomyces monomycini]|uniref:MalY/PatB family protein n=1 Tax=Streptomyces monomycini TaxID=371720 RepID=UPI00067C0C7A|nr:aminotransferase class I/II-fold pyridoxal phosphate-dependent enzyme [Streptomyces monomycini]